jgi:hypothetical protein
MAGFRRPKSVALCILSALWVLIGFWTAVRLCWAGNYFGSGIMLLFGVTALGLWFQSRLSAWVLLVFAGVGGIYTLCQIGQLPGIRVLIRLSLALAAVLLLAEFLKESKDD